MKALPSIARAVSSSPDAYVYLAESIRAWPDQPGLAARIESAGWGDVGLAQPHRRDRRAAPGDGLGTPQDGEPRVHGAELPSSHTARRM